MTTASELVRKMVAGSVTSAYDVTDSALREVENHAPDVASMVRTARDLLFAARVKLEQGE